jgi:hypothetical protein
MLNGLAIVMAVSLCVAIAADRSAGDSIELSDANLPSFIAGA